MTSKKNVRVSLAVAAVALVSVIVLTSWDFKRTFFMMPGDEPETCDTIPQKEKREKKIRDLDDVINELGEAEIKINLEKMHKELAEALKKIDGEKIRLDVERAMKEVDFSKIQKEIQESLAKIDMDKMKMEIDASLSKIEWDKMKTELEKVKEMDMKKLELDMEKMEKELSKIGPEIEKSLEKAKVELDKVKAEMKEYNEFVGGLEKDKLLNRKDGYTLTHKDGELFINGKKAAEATYNKYRRFLEKHKKFTIKKSDDDFNIDID
jgi:DNA repair exonuclease SbcCD ATPase subunit